MTDEQKAEQKAAKAVLAFRQDLHELARQAMKFNGNVDFQAPEVVMPLLESLERKAGRLVKFYRARCEQARKNRG